MAITTIDGIVAGMRPPENIYKVGATMEAGGIQHSLFYSPGMPGAAVVSVAGVNGEALTTYAGQIPWVNPGAGYSYIARFHGMGTSIGSASLADRLWHNSGLVVTTTTQQTIATPTWPARDRDGTTSGVGVLVGIEVVTTTGNGSAITNCTLNYTNSVGTTGRTGTMLSFPATAVAGSFVPFELAAGDVGVKSIEGITLGTSLVSGTISLVAFRYLGRVDLPTANTGQALDPITGGFIRCHDNTVPFVLWMASSTTAVTFIGQMLITQG